MLNNKKAILFDCDGVLISATNWHYKALNQALGLFGYGIDKDDHIKVYNGLPTAEKLKMMTHIPVSLHGIIRVQKKLYTKKQIELHCKPDYSKILMLKYLKKEGLKLVCCSNAIQSSVEEMLKRALIYDYFDDVIGNDVGFKSKPSPDIYLEAMRRFALKPEDCLIVEDAPHGIAAAKASGAEVIEVSGYDDVDLSLFGV